MAIKKSIKSANPREIILIAGKGHEEIKIYKNKSYNFSDKEIVKKIVFKSKKINKKNFNLIENKKIFKKFFKKIKPINYNGLSIDTRSLKKNNLFLAIKGKKNNGNEFINYAFKKGAAFVVTDSKKEKRKKVFKVNNSVKFLNLYAKIKEKILLQI